MPTQDNAGYDAERPRVGFVRLPRAVLHRADLGRGIDQVAEYLRALVAAGRGARSGVVRSITASSRRRQRARRQDTGRSTPGVLAAVPLPA
jgi:hypothetical protein